MRSSYLPLIEQANLVFVAEAQHSARTQIVVNGEANPKPRAKGRRVPRKKAVGQEEALGVVVEVRVPQQTLLTVACSKRHRRNREFK